MYLMWLLRTLVFFVLVGLDCELVNHLDEPSPLGTHSFDLALSCFEFPPTFWALNLFDRHPNQYNIQTDLYRKQ